MSSEGEKYKNKYRTTSARLNGWDYGSHALYYVTICTKNRINYFGTVEAIEASNVDKIGTFMNALVQKTKIGQIAYENWISIPDFFTFVELDEFVIMPNHIHGILFINKPDKLNWEVNKFGPQKGNLGAVIRGYKSSVQTFATTNNIEFSWQARYYDHVIRNQKEYENICAYIFDNPANWLANRDDEIEIFYKKLSLP